MAVIDDLERMARLVGLSLSREDLGRLEPPLGTLYADLERLLALPILDLEPAFTPRLAPGAAEGGAATR